MSIIDTTKPEFADVPASLNGEVLLDRPEAGGYITATLAAAKAMKAKTPAEIAAAGWDKYQHILDSLP